MGCEESVFREAKFTLNMIHSSEHVVKHSHLSRRALLDLQALAQSSAIKGKHARNARVARVARVVTRTVKVTRGARVARVAKTYAFSC